MDLISYDINGNPIELKLVKGDRLPGLTKSCIESKVEFVKFNHKPKKEEIIINPERLVGLISGDNNDQYNSNVEVTVSEEPLINQKNLVKGAKLTLNEYTVIKGTIRDASQPEKV